MGHYEDSAFESLAGSSRWLSAEIAFIKLQLALRSRAAQTKFNPNWPAQPRAPAGTPEGGQWIDTSPASQARPRSARLPRTRLGAPTLEESAPIRRLPLAAFRGTGSALILPVMLTGDTPRPDFESHIVPGTDDLVFTSLRDRGTGREFGYFSRIVAPERRVPIVIFGLDTGIRSTEPARTTPLDVAVSIDRGGVTFDAAALAAAYGREIPGITTAAVAPTPPPGSGIETHTQDEADLVEAMRASRRSNAQIQIALDTVRRNRSAEEATATSFRNEPGVVRVSTPLPPITGRWLQPDQHAALPGQIAERLEGRYFRNFGQLRSAIWRSVADTPELAQQFSEQDNAYMRRGRAPTAPQDQWYGPFPTYMLHHNDPISEGGAVFDLSNISVVTPLAHQNILDPSRHFGRRRRQQETRGQMTRDELLHLVYRIKEQDGTESEVNALIVAMAAAVPHAKISDLMFHSKIKRTSEELVDEALRLERLWREANQG